MASNMGAGLKGPLNVELSKACEEAWSWEKPACEGYFLGYDPKSGDVDAFLNQLPDLPDMRRLPLAETSIASPPPAKKRGRARGCAARPVLGTMAAQKRDASIARRPEGKADAGVQLLNMTERSFYD